MPSTVDAWLPLWATPARLALILYVTGLAINLTFGAVYQFRSSPAEFEADEIEYYHLATSMMAGEFPMLGRRTAAYPLIMAGVRSLWDNVIFLQVVVCAIYSISAPALSMVAARLTGSMLFGAACGVALMLWPPAIFYGTSLYSEAVALPVFLLTLYFMPVGSRVPKASGGAVVGSALVAGLLLGITTHVRPMYLLFLPVAAIIFLVEERSVRLAAGRFLLFVAAFMAIILPWSVFVSTRLNQPILVTANGGETLSGGLTPQLFQPHSYAGTPVKGRIPWVGPGKWLTIANNGYLSESERALPYQQVDRLLRSRVVEWVKNNPLDAAYIQAAKLGYMWGIYPFFGNGIAQSLLGNIPTMLLLFFALIGLARRPDARAPLVRLWILPVFVSGVAMISWGSWRFRQPGDAGLLAFCVILCGYRIASRRAGKPASSDDPPYAPKQELSAAAK